MALGPQQRDRLQTLIDRMFDGSITPAEFGQLDELLSGDAEARQFYLHQVDLVNSLRWQTSGTVTHQSLAALQSLLRERGAPEPSRARPRRPWSKVVALAAAVLLAVSAGLYFWPPGRTTEPQAVGSLERLEGTVEITSADGSKRMPGSGRGIRPGDTVRTEGEQSSAELVYGDGTRFVLTGRTSLKSLDAKTGVEVREGTLTASVEPQSQDRPMVVLTPQAKIEVLGTKFFLSVTAERTELGVTEGRVRLTRQEDGQSAEVVAGRSAVAGGKQALVVQDLYAAAEEWSEDFEAGLPAGWKQGKWITAGLPTGSKGAVQAVFGSQVQVPPYFQIVTHTAWANGLFKVGKNSHLHFTYKLARPGWVQILLVAQKRQEESPVFSGVYFLEPADLKAREQWWGVPAEAWHTASVPLAKFRILSTGKRPAEDDVCYTLNFSAQDRDRGLALDRVWVTRDGPGEIDFRPVE